MEACRRSLNELCALLDLKTRASRTAPHDSNNRATIARAAADCPHPGNLAICLDLGAEVMGGMCRADDGSFVSAFLPRRVALQSVTLVVRECHAALAECAHARHAAGASAAPIVLSHIAVTRVPNNAQPVDVHDTVEMMVATPAAPALLGDNGGVDVARLLRGTTPPGFACRELVVYSPPGSDGDHDMSAGAQPPPPPAATPRSVTETSDVAAAAALKRLTSAARDDDGGGGGAGAADATNRAKRTRVEPSCGGPAPPIMLDVGWWSQHQQPVGGLFRAGVPAAAALFADAAHHHPSLRHDGGAMRKRSLDADAALPRAPQPPPPPLGGQHDGGAAAWSSSACEHRKRFCTEAAQHAAAQPPLLAS